MKDPTPDEISLIRSLVEEHARRTGSPLGVKMLYRFDDIVRYFVKVVPREYEQVMMLVDEFEQRGLAHEDAVERAFECRNGLMSDDEVKGE